MGNMNCTEAREQLDDLIDGYLDRAEKARVSAHVAGCAGCDTQMQRLRELRRGLREMPAPEPRPAFIDAALAAASAAAGREPVAAREVVMTVITGPSPAGDGTPVDEGGGRWARFVSGMRRHQELWLGAAMGGAVVAALAIALLGPQHWSEEANRVPEVTVALNEAREVGLVIDSERSMVGATVTLHLSGGIDLAGFGEQRRISWQTDLEPGANLLSLPVIAHSLEGGILTALVEHEARTRSVAVKVRVQDAPAG
jgi:anti-sigma factor RsiW